MNCDVAVCLKTNGCTVIYSGHSTVSDGKSLLVKSIFYEVKSLYLS